ncbi:calcium-binding protein [Tropicibacter naphthalenivorans]|uniref:Hemolysin, chromosomal n=1 Tax=Tropicibacter naphthalenivorans TaxID=441103 RepID=A0A0N7LZ08_9RHOB|nr:calcium-binding protein [Tropicibacter naphthalenivorans]CUH76345.1 Hemolysin, chromosomal [Tropicibacter naphthalenivorans]SMC67729.1 Hemolysin-type calcium-binding repeat-containing protein [Tropicibacter naphthalenivorans]
MAFTVTGADLTSQVVVADTDMYVLQQPGSIVTTTSGMNLQGSADVRIEGDIFARGAAINDSGSTIEGDIFISTGVNATLWSTGDTVSLQTDVALFQLMNQGTIQSMDSGVFVKAKAAEVINTGYIGGHGDTYTNAIWLKGFDTATSDLYVSNSGTLAALQTNTASGVSTVFFDDADLVRFSNSGEVLSDGRSLRIYDTVRAYVDNSGLLDGRVYVHYDTDEVNFTNSGTIGFNTANESLLLYADIVRLNNSGFVGGDMDVYYSSVATVTNTGYFAGDITFDNQNDTYRGLGDGLVAGTVYGDAGADTLSGGELGDRLDGGNDNDRVLGGGGNDILAGGDGADRVFGDNGDDVVDGGTGDDFIFGGNGDDLMTGGGGADFGRGGYGNDEMNGGIGNDTFYGGVGDDTLNGNDDADRLYGEDGNDEIDGGAGRDVIYTGSGLDTIVFTNAADSAVGAQRDVIYDFEQGADVIDVVNVVGGVLSFVGTSAFTGSANEIRVVEAAGSSRVQIDVTADGVADMEFLLSGFTGLEESDFLL